MAQSKTAVIRSDLDIVIARTMARDMAKALGFGPIDQARIATAVSELARNIFLYAGTGNVTVRDIEKGSRKGIEIICEDQGPGIPNIDLVMQDGYSTSRGMGMGLPGAKRLMDEFDIKSKEGVGTTIVCRKRRRTYAGCSACQVRVVARSGWQIVRVSASLPGEYLRSRKPAARESHADVVRHQASQPVVALHRHSYRHQMAQ
ncbi:MAG: hypothetical protein KatS3mg056_0342 [Chloroflexus sp.]|nr:MAG: hypothetical protein KatS3mg056_0342 [Chloroflexus sp.]